MLLFVRTASLGRGMHWRTLDSMEKTSSAAPWKSQRVANLAAAYAISGGVITLAGWALHYPRLTDWNNSGISMFPNTAVCAILSGVTLCLLNAQRDEKR